MKTCEICGKEHDGSFGSGRFCSRACANSRIVTDSTREKMSMRVKQVVSDAPYKCPICHQRIKTKSKFDEHIKTCTDEKRLSVYKRRHEKRNVVLRDGTKLDITYGELERYLVEHPNCEICGRHVMDTIKTKSKFSPHRLCIDHDHNTNKFRGLLCSVCNRQLGWYEKNRDAISKYLNEVR